MQPTYESNYQNQSVGAAANQVQQAIARNVTQHLNQYSDYATHQVGNQMALHNRNLQNNLNGMARMAMENIMQGARPLPMIPDNMVDLRRSNGIVNDGVTQYTNYQQYSAANQPMMIGPPMAVPPPPLPVMPRIAQPIQSEIINEVEVQPVRAPQMYTSQYNLGTERNLTNNIRTTEMIIPPAATHKPQRAFWMRICPCCTECQDGCLNGTKRYLGQNCCCCCWPDPISQHNRKSNIEFKTCCYSRCLCCYTFCPWIFKACSCLPCCGVPATATRKASDYPLPGDMGNRGCFGCCPCETKKDQEGPVCCSALCPQKSCCRMWCREACGIC